MPARWRLRQVDPRLAGKVLSSSSRRSFLVCWGLGGNHRGGPASCLFLFWPGTAWRGLGMVLPVVLATTEVEFQMLPVGSGEALALDFPQQRFEVAQPVHRLRGGPVDQCHRLAHAAEQDGLPDRFQWHALGVPGNGKTLVSRAEGRLHAGGAEEGLPHGLDVGRGVGTRLDRDRGVRRPVGPVRGPHGPHRAAVLVGSGLELADAGANQFAQVAS